MKFRKKSGYANAIQLDLYNANECRAFILDTLKKRIGRISFFYKDGDLFKMEIETIEGVCVTAYCGSWIVNHEPNQLRIMSTTELHSEYEEAEQE